ncbi:membrane protein [Streptococcus infantis]|nr:membrane protein [Streptococcus infantis]
MFFVYLVFQLLKDLVKWDQILKVTKDNARKVRLLVVLCSIGLGYLISSFFLNLYQLWQEAVRDLL